jgi:hypothetical protein
LLLVGHWTDFTPVGWQSKRNKKWGFRCPQGGFWKKFEIF